MKPFYLLILFFILTNPIYTNEQADSFKFRRNTQYNIEYQVTENQTRIFKDIYFKSDWIIPTMTKQRKNEKKGTFENNEETTFKYFVEFIQIDEKGNRVSHVLQKSRIIMISLVLIEAKETNTNTAKPLQKEDLSLQLK